jgi:hypothetical protein
MIDDVPASADAKVDVDVRKADSAWVKEPLEDKVIL